MTVFLYLLCLSVIVFAAGGWALWQRYVQAARIPETEIETSVRALLVRNGDDPLRLARIETYQAWLDGDLRAQGKWKRVELALKRRLVGRAS